MAENRQLKRLSAVNSQPSIPHRLRILFVIDSLRMGGAEKSLVTLLNLLPVADMDIEVMRMSPAGRLEPLLPAGIRLSRISLHRPGLIGRARFMAARAAMYLSRRFSTTPTHPNDRFWRFMRHSVPPLERQYDIAVAYQQGFPTAFVATRVNARRKIAWVNADVAAAGYDAQFNRPFYRAMTHIVTVSDTLHTLFCSRYPSLASRVTAIPDIVDARAIRRLAEVTPSPYPDRDDDPARPLRLLTVARMEHVKGLDLAVEAARLLHDSGLDFHWHFIGDGNERAAIASLVSRHSLCDRITLHGTVTNPYPWMRGCDIYIQPSRHEGYGIAIAEAMTLCRPVIATDFAVAHDHIDGSNGLIAPISPRGIADAITMLAEPRRRRQITDRLINTYHNDLTSLQKVTAILTS